MRDHGRPTCRAAAIAALVVALGVAACGSTPDTAAGLELFNRDELGAERGCSYCHSVTSRPGPSGPSLLGIGARASDRVTGVGAEDYLRESILAPAAFLAPGWGPGMPSYGAALSDIELDALIDYLRSLR